MRRARIERTGQPVFAREIDRQPLWRGEDLVCWEHACSAAVRATGGYTKRDGTPYTAYFSLKANVEHDGDCPLNPVEVITSIAQGSEGLATVDEGVLRLTLPQDLSQPGTQRPGLDGTPVDGEVVDRRITTVPPLLPPLINSAVKIVRFLAAHDFDSKVVNRFRVLPYGAKKAVRWEKFCFGPTYTSYTELYALIRAGKRPLHPVAVYGTVQQILKDRNERPYAVLATADPTGVMKFEVVLRSLYPSLIKPLDVGTHVLAVGDWDVWADGPIPQLRLFTKHHWETAYWTSDEATGALSEPTSPPALTDRQPAAVKPARTSTARTGRSDGAVGKRLASSPDRNTPTTPATPPLPLNRPARIQAPQPADPTEPGPVTEPADTPAAVQPIASPARDSAPDTQPAPDSATEPAAAEDQTAAPIPPAPSAPPRPSCPPRPASPPPLPPRRRRQGLADLFDRRRKKRH
jgi:hypothetical protein